MVLPGKGLSVCHLLGNSWGWDEQRLTKAARGSGTQRRVVQARTPATHLINLKSSPGSLCRAGAHQTVPHLASLRRWCLSLGRRQGTLR